MESTSLKGQLIKTAWEPGSPKRSAIEQLLRHFPKLSGPGKLRLAFDSLGGKAANVEHQAYFAMLARAMLEAGHIDDVLEALDFVFTLGPQRWVRPEFLRIKAGTERAKGQIDQAEATLSASLRDTDEIEVPSFKFRAAYDLASLLHERGDSTEARELLAPLYNQFSDGFDTRDSAESP